MWIQIDVTPGQSYNVKFYQPPFFQIPIQHLIVQRQHWKHRDSV